MCVGVFQPYLHGDLGIKQEELITGKTAKKIATVVFAKCASLCEIVKICKCNHTSKQICVSFAVPMSHWQFSTVNQNNKSIFFSSAIIKEIN